MNLLLLRPRRPLRVREQMGQNVKLRALDRHLELARSQQYRPSLAMILGCLGQESPCDTGHGSQVKQFPPILHDTNIPFLHTCFFCNSFLIPLFNI